MVVEIVRFVTRKIALLQTDGQLIIGPNFITTKVLLHMNL